MKTLTIPRPGLGFRLMLPLSNSHFVLVCLGWRGGLVQTLCNFFRGVERGKFCPGFVLH